MNQIEPFSTPLEPAGLNSGGLSERARAYVRAGIAQSTTRGYGRDWRQFNRWCASTNRAPLPATADTLAEYVAELASAGTAPATITRAMAAIRTAHHAAKQDPPDTTTARAVLRGYRRTDAAPGQPAPALLISDLRKMLDAMPPEHPAYVRDRAVILLQWAMMARRSEIAALDVTDLAMVSDGIHVTVRKSKTDQEAAGEIVAVPYGSHPDTCPVRAVQAWLSRLGQAEGPLFRPIDRHGRMGGDPQFAGRSRDLLRITPQAIEVILRRAALQAGLPTGRGTGFTPHSLRAGGATEAYQQGGTPLAIARHGRWKDGSPVVLGYIRTVDRWKENPMIGIGL